MPRLGEGGDEAPSIDITATLADVQAGETTDAVDLGVPEVVERPVVVSFQDVAIEYPKRGRVPAFRAADHIDLEIHEGEVVGLVGESGSGKTTLGRATVGLLPIHSGP